MNFPRGDNYEIAKILWRNLKIFLAIWQKASLGEEDLSLFKWIGHTFLQWKIIKNCKNTFTKFQNLLLLNYKANFIIYILFIITLLKYIHWFELVSQVSDVAHGPPVFFLPHLSWKLKWAFWSHVVRRLSVRPSVCSSFCLSVCKLFTFSSSSPEQLGQFQPNLAQIILGWWGLRFIQI